MTAYKSPVRLGSVAADVAVALGAGRTYSGEVQAGIDNETSEVPSVLLTAAAVTKENVSETILADKVYTSEAICDGIADACTAAGIS